MPFLTHGSYRIRYELDGPANAPAYVLVNGLTTMVGFGSMMIADHRGIFGLGLLLTIGMGTTLIATLAVLPVLLRLAHPAPPPPPPAARIETEEPATAS